MKRQMLRISALLSSSKGQTMAEYALIMAAVAVVALVAYNALGTQISSYVNTVKGCL